ncbi:MAG: hypothetical protein ACI4N3_00100 [Alphaproteobacteria bacterium]
MQKTKKNIIDIVKSLFTDKTLKKILTTLKIIIILYFSLPFFIILFNSIRLQSNFQNNLWFVYIYILALAFYFSFMYFLMVQASKKFLVHLILLMYLLVNLLFFPQPYREMILIISLLLFFIFALLSNGGNKNDK